MTSKKEIITKTYGSSWVAIMGFLVAFVMVFVAEFLVLACCIPFVGIYLYWIWSCWFFNWLINIAFAGNQALINNFLTLSLIPLILFGIFGTFLFVVISVIAVVAIGALISALS